MNVWVATGGVAVASSIVLLFPALGEIIAERSGVLNLGVDGMMLMGAVCGFMGMQATENRGAGVATGILAGAVAGLFFAAITVSIRVDQTVAGIALAILGGGVSAWIGRDIVGEPAKLVFHPVAIPGLSDIPVIGPMFFNHDVLVYVAYVCVPIVWIALFRLRWGLHVRTVGENPAAGDALGVNVVSVRYTACLIGGAFAGLGGAYLSLARSPGWSEGMTAGRGWIAVALVIVSRWNPLWALIGGIAFGGLEALNFLAQAKGIGISPYLLSMLPYIATIGAMIVAAIWGKRYRRAPAALGVPYHR